MTLQVVDAPERQRYEAIRDGAVLGFAAYQKANELIVFTHTEVDPSFEGQGIGGALVRGALDHVRNLGLRVLPPENPQARGCLHSACGAETDSPSSSRIDRSSSLTGLARP